MTNEQQKIGNKRHKKIIGTIERCFMTHKKDNINVLTLSQVKEWIRCNYKNGISTRRLSVFLYRKPQFMIKKKARWKNSNHFETWWSLGDVDEEDIDAHPNWIDVCLKCGSRPSYPSYDRTEAYVCQEC